MRRTRRPPSGARPYSTGILSTTNLKEIIMALGNVFIKDVDGNIPYDTGSSGEKVTGLLFDVSLQPTLFTEGYGKTNETRLKPGDVCYITSFKSAVNDFGIIERVEATDEEEMNVNFLHGIPAYHIREFSACPAIRAVQENST